MGRVNKTAAIYLLTNKITGRKYVGQTSNLKDRMSYYKSTEQRVEALTQDKYRPVEYAIADFGWDNFKVDILDDSPELENEEYRLMLESYYITTMKTFHIKYGYNIHSDVSDKKFKKCLNKQFKHKTSTKILKSEPIITYEIATGEIFIWLGCKSFADELNLDRAIISRAAKHGKSTHGYYIFYLDRNKRNTIINEVLYRKNHSTDRNSNSHKSIGPYSTAVDAVDKFAKYWGC